MFTPGSKYFLGLTGLAAVATVLYLFLVNPSDLGATAIIGVLISGATISGFTLLNRDGDVDTAEQAVEAAAQPAPASMWPLVFAFGAALLLLGLATEPIVFVIAIGVLVGGGVEWMIQDWADRASADSTYNEFARARAISALEYPGLAAVGVGIIAFLFSRIMLTASKGGAAVIFIIVATLILVAGSLVVSKSAFRGRNAVRIATVGAVLLAGAGVVSALNGERPELAKAAKEDHFAMEHRECGEEESEHYDKLPNEKVSLRSSVAATITVEDGKVFAQLVGLPTKVDSISVPRSNPTTILFRNRDAEPRRLVINLGTAKVAETGVTEKVGTCTQLTEEGKENALTFTIAKPSIDQKYSLTVPGVSGEIKLVVP